MNIEEYSKGVTRTLKVLYPPVMNQVHMLMGMLTEVGELTDAFKKNIAYGKKIDWVNVEEEIGDILYYTFGFCSLNGLDLEKIFERNLAKLKVRYPEKFSEERALNRDLGKERETLERIKQDAKATQPILFDEKQLEKDKRIKDELGY